MAYERNTLISRPGYSGVGCSSAGMGDIWDTISGAAGSVLKFYGTEQQAQGAAAAAAQTNKDLAAAMAANQGISTSTLLIGGLAIGAVALIVLKKHKE